IRRARSQSLADGALLPRDTHDPSAARGGRSDTCGDVQWIQSAQVLPKARRLQDDATNDQMLCWVYLARQLRREHPGRRRIAKGWFVSLYGPHREDRFIGGKLYARNRLIARIQREKKLRHFFGRTSPLPVKSQVA